MTVEARGVAPEAPVDGRWTLQRCNGCGRIAMGRRGTEWCFDTEQREPQTSVPVVPCDDAAVKRAARLLAEMWPDDFDPAGRGTFNVRAQQVTTAVLRAAGAPDA
jgi:hypothetical protein